MEPGWLTFAQILDFQHRHEFDASVRRYEGDTRVHGFVSGRSN